MKLIVYDNGKGELTWSDSLATFNKQTSNIFYVLENLIKVSSKKVKADLISWIGSTAITRSIICKIHYLTLKEDNYIGFIEVIDQFKSTNICSHEYLVVYISTPILPMNTLKLTVPDINESDNKLEMKFKFNPSYCISIGLMNHSINSSKAESILYNESDYPEINKRLQNLINSTNPVSMNTDNHIPKKEEAKDDCRKLESIIETEMHNLTNQIKTTSENIINAIKSDPKVKKEVNRLTEIKHLFKDHVKKFCDEVKTVMED